MAEPLDLRGMKRSELLALKFQYETEMVSIRSQIERAKAEARQRGSYAEPTWWCKVHQALRIKGSQCQAIQLELSRLKIAQTYEINARFVEVARRQLPEETFTKILDEARVG